VLPDGHGLVQHAATRAVIDLASGVRWERLTPRSDDRTDFLEVIYTPDGHSTDERRALRHGVLEPDRPGGPGRLGGRAPRAGPRLSAPGC
jgi:hypothetical protein